VVERLARVLLRRYGVVFKRTLARESAVAPGGPVPWRDLHRVYRMLELRGEVRGGRFVNGFSGEQFATPEAIPLLRKVRKEDPAGVEVAAADPLNLRGVLTPDGRISRASKQHVLVGVEA
jgi:ATP-dependent Lhr-like helicase